MAKKSEIMVTDSEENTAFIDMSDVKIKKLNLWKGWFCGLGMENINILNSGRTFGAVCKSGGELGNIYKSFELKKEPTICPVESCHCGSDIFIPKAKTKAEFDKIKKHDINAPRAVLDKAIAFDGNFKLRELNRIAINWNVGKRCNFDCSYCPEYVHDKKSPHIPMTDFMQAITNLEKNLSDDKKMKITFSGGEPTINPNFFAFVSYLKNKFKEDITLVTNTNGSRTKDYLYTLNKFSSLLFSVHLEFIDVEKFIKKIYFLAEKRRDEVKNSKEHFMTIKIMVTPDTVTKGKDLFFEVIKARKSAHEFKVSIEPIVNKEDGFKLLEYTPQQKKLVQQINEYDRLMQKNLSAWIKYFTNKKILKSKQKINDTIASL